MTNVVAVEYDHIADETQRDIFREYPSVVQHLNTADPRRTRPARCCPLRRREAPGHTRSLGYMDRRAAQEIHSRRGYPQRRHSVGYQARQAIPGSGIDGPSLSRSHEDEPADFHRDAQVAREGRRSEFANPFPPCSRLKSSCV
jgi:hypothetical protein